MPRAALLIALLVLAAPARCGREGTPEPEPPPRIGDQVRLRGTLGEDVDCRLFRTDSGQTYSLSTRLRGYANGAKVCIEGTLTNATGCIQSPMIEVQRLRPASECR